MRLRLDGQPIYSATIYPVRRSALLSLSRMCAVCALLLVISTVGAVTLYADEEMPVHEPAADGLIEPASEEASATTDEADSIVDNGVDVIGLDVNEANVDGDDEPLVGAAAYGVGDDVNADASPGIDAAAADVVLDEHESSRAAESEAERSRSESGGEPALSVDVKTEVMALPAWRLLEPAYAAETPLPVSGKAMYYNPGVMERVLETRLKYDHVELCEGCIGRAAMLRFGDVDRKVWLQFNGLRVEGPFHVIDAAATQHIGMLIERGWILDVDYQTAQRWGMRMPYVTIWSEPPLDMLLANIAIPLNWRATMSPASPFSRSPQSTERAMAGQAVGYVATKQSLKIQQRDVDSYVDLFSDLPSELYVK